MMYTEPQTIQKIALTGQFASLDEDLTGIENLICLADCSDTNIGLLARGMDLLRRRADQGGESTGQKILRRDALSAGYCRIKTLRHN